MRQYRDTRYWVDKEGNVYSYWPKKISSFIQSNGKKQFKIDRPEGKYKLLKPGNSIYRHVALTINGKAKSMLVHRIVAECYLGPCPEGMEVDHIDGNPHNNSISNLQYISHTNNIRKRFIYPSK